MVGHCFVPKVALLCIIVFSGIIQQVQAAVHKFLFMINQAPLISIIAMCKATRLLLLSIIISIQVFTQEI